MDNKALAETYVDLYHYVCDSYEAKTGNQPTTEEANMIFEQTCKRIMNVLIDEQQHGASSKQKQSGDDKPTDKQMAFAKKLGCDKPEGFSKKELSAWIEEHKEW